jgi:glycosyltransferase involved in cell wall biosynthesis
MDIFVMPSLKEGLGLALMEAMAQGIAVIGSAVGGIKTLIQNEATGLLVEPADSQALALALARLGIDAGLRRSLGQRARQFIMANFSQEEMVGQTQKIYQQVLEKQEGEPR